LVFKKTIEAFTILQILAYQAFHFLLKDEYVRQNKHILYINFYFCLDWGPRHQFSNWAPQFIAPALDTRYEHKPGPRHGEVPPRSEPKSAVPPQPLPPPSTSDGH